MECETSASLGNQRRSSYKMPVPPSSKEVVAIMKYFMEGMPKSAGIHEIELWESQPLLIPYDAHKSLGYVKLVMTGCEMTRVIGYMASSFARPIKIFCNKPSWFSARSAISTRFFCRWPFLMRPLKISATRRAIWRRISLCPYHPTSTSRIRIHSLGPWVFRIIAYHS